MIFTVSQYTTTHVSQKTYALFGGLFLSGGDNIQQPHKGELRKNDNISLLK